MITLYDSIDTSQIPSDAPAVAGYTSGNWPTWSSLAAKFPNAHRLSIAVNAAENADALDIENGDATIGDAPGWYARQRARGVTRPCFYASAGNMNSLITTYERAGIPRGAVRLWAAHYNGEHICGPGSCRMTSISVDGCQWTDTAMGRNLDQSLLADDFFGTPPAPPAPAPVIAVWVTKGQDSLAALCTGALHNGVSTVLRLTAERSPHGLYTAGTTSYLDQVFAASKAKVPPGVTVWHPYGGTVTSFSSHGDQTLQGLALAWNCGPSAIVRLTAEHTPGQVFGSGMAKYLDSVFAASTLKVPAGTSLYYQK